uniref:Uncharacterized protein n=1 Tax=Rhizophagus irregularis (strain DAOM 181602 / DAOM 197198 / MUCL 43194) TaxID=747089 RepID=U9TPR9_RHIID
MWEVNRSRDLAIYTEAAIHCMSILKEHGLLTGAAKYLIVDCNNEEKRRKFNRRLY